MDTSNWEQDYLSGPKSKTTVNMRDFRLETLIWQNVPEKRYQIVSDPESYRFEASKLSECRQLFDTVFILWTRVLKCKDLYFL